MQRGRESRLRLEAAEAAGGPGPVPGVLTAAEKARLRRRVKEGDRARDTFIEANLRLVQMYLNRMRLPAGVSESDVSQEGVIGLMRAVDGFDWSRGNRFSTYASQWIKMTMTKAVTRAMAPVSGTANARNMARSAYRAAETFRATHGRDASEDEIAAILDVTVERLAVIRAASAPQASLEAPVAGWDQPGAPVTLKDTLADADAEAPLLAAENASALGTLRRLISELPEEERIALTERMSDDKTSGKERKRQTTAASRAVSRLRHPAMPLTEAMAESVAD